nr:hypothetical protein [uncultured Flavobacterium sp.]
MNLEAIYDEMQWNVIKRFVFYMPNNEYSKMLFDDETLIGMDQKIYYVDGDKKVNEYPNIDLLDFYSKEKLLKNNFFKLLELKSKMDKDAFILFYDTYLNKLEGFVNIADLIRNYIQRDIVDCSKTVWTYVNFNFGILSEHRDLIKGIVPSAKEVEPKIEKFDVSILEGLPIEIKNNFKPEPRKNADIPFITFIRHENKIEIERIIKDHYSDLRGVKLRYLIEFLKEEGLLLLNHGDATKLHNSIKILFEGKNIGAYTSVFDNKVFSITDQKYINSKISFAKMFKEIL